MKRDRWLKIDKLFAAALERGEQERAAFLDEACAGDTALRREVEQMLKFDARAEDFIETPVLGIAAGLIAKEEDASAQQRAGVARQRGALKGSAPEAAARHEPHLSASAAIDGAGFAPGAALAERYRIVSLLGRGGMGEVYRADDLKLKQPVALKFLPESLSQDSASLARFYQEVSVARQISHRHVCRVYDIGETDGRHFISMEYIKGEELASLLRRIGRLPQDKAIEIARQLCAGLAAIHEQGALHRDLKPANIMIDERGDARITDFGIAALAGEIRGHEALAGTPAYMSPEQLAGREVTFKSDIYSLGLVLYEIFTGKRAFNAPNMPELMRLRQSEMTPTSPSSLVPNLDPLVERVIQRCLEREPERRPASALQVAAALPGGDPLAAALAAGETPSPEMVAAAPKEGLLKPWVALSLLACVVIGIALVMVLSAQTLLHRRVPLRHSPDALTLRAEEITRRFGYTAPPTDTAHGFFVDYEYLDYLRGRDPSPERWERLRTGQPAIIKFWHRQSPRYLEPYAAWRVDVADPPPEVSGMVRVTLDTLGRLVYFEAVPPQLDVAANAAVTQAPDWSALLREAGFDPANLQPTASQWTPPQAYDTRAAWDGFFTDAPDVPVRVEAAGYRGLPVYFEIVSPWRRPAQQVLMQRSAAERIVTPLLFGFYFGAFILGALLAWKNLRLGRGDRRGAFRLMLFIFALKIIHWAFYTHHVPTSGEVTNLLLSGLQAAVFEACVVGIMYLALEPFLRRRWPERIISWSRLLGGDLRDPLVGRDILIGAAFGVIEILFINLQDVVPAWFGGTPNPPSLNSPLLYWLGLLGLNGFVPLTAAALRSSLLFGFILVFIILFFAMLLRRNWLGIGVAWLILAGLIFLRTIDFGLATALIALLVPTAIIFVAVRFGLLALISMFLFQHLWAFFPITTELSAWYATSFVLFLILLLALTLYGFYTSLAGQPLFRTKFLDD